MLLPGYPDDLTMKNVLLAVVFSLVCYLCCGFHTYVRCLSSNVLSLRYLKGFSGYWYCLPSFLQDILQVYGINISMSTTKEPSNTSRRVTLSPEIFLRLAEEVVATSPQDIKSLLLLSKPFYNLFKNYERSICASILTDNRYTCVNADDGEVISSRMPIGTNSLRRLTYPWTAEMLFRVKTVEFLVNHQITDMNDHIGSQSWPTLAEHSKEELHRRLLMFKIESFALLYKLADCTSGLSETSIIRAHQAEFLESLTNVDLACLGVLVEVMGQNYFTMTKKAIDEANSNTAMTTTRHRRPSQDWFFTPSFHLAYEDEAASDHWIRECMCVFEDLTQRYGPRFPFIFLTGKKDIRRPDLWARTMLQEGLDNMNAFELGYTMSYASLQSVVWRVFCRKEGCRLGDSWGVGRSRVEEWMRGLEGSD